MRPSRNAILNSLSFVLRVTLHSHGNLLRTTLTMGQLSRVKRNIGRGNLEKSNPFNQAQTVYAEEINSALFD